jgi:hypothetical protein
MLVRLMLTHPKNPVNESRQKKSGLDFRWENQDFALFLTQNLKSAIAPKRKFTFCCNS